MSTASANHDPTPTSPDRTSLLFDLLLFDLALFFSLPLAESSVLLRSSRFLLQLERHRIGAGRAVPQLFFRLGKMLSVFGDSGLLEIHHVEACRCECLPVI